MACLFMPNARERSSGIGISGDRSRTAKLFKNQGLFAAILVATPLCAVPWHVRIGSARNSRPWLLEFNRLQCTRFPRRSASASLKPDRRCRVMPEMAMISEAISLGLIEARWRFLSLVPPYGRFPRRSASASLKRGLTNHLIAGLFRFPRRSASASLKPNQITLSEFSNNQISEAISLGLIEAMMRQETGV